MDNSACADMQGIILRAASIAIGQPAITAPCESFVAIANLL
jgi:hypothetical protein